MTRRSIPCISAALLLPILLCAALLWANFDGVGHDFSGRCQECHLAVPENGEVGLFSRDINYLCRECHNVSEKNSHPVGMVPSMEMPEGFSLDWGGRMSCATCHDPHTRTYSGDTEFLRTEARGKMFCELCHKGFLPIEGTHVGSVGIAHSKRGVYYDRSTIERVLDKISLECLNCHDGVIASDAGHDLIGGEALTYNQRGLSHPIGMDYRRAATRDRELRAVEALSPLIALYDGKVGCASCHNPYSNERRMLVLSNWGSALCLECHIK